MKKLVIVSLVLVLAMIVGSSGLAYGAGGANQLNGQEAAGEGAPTEALSCWIKNSVGTTVTQVKRSNPWTYAVRGYWVGFGGGIAWTRAVVTIVINHTGLPEQRIVQYFAISPAYAGTTVTPFAITDWAGAAANGNGLVIVDISNGVSTNVCTCSFVTRPF